ncbi:MAG: hypothetical protein KAT39_02050 [Alphaproteobacteria bacterium]|nr:hypothetical protein [Alphaproteobacteria bacterium]
MAGDPTETEDSQDAAWVTIETPLTADALLAFCREDIERLFRINSLLKFEEWHHGAENEHRVRLLNSVTGKELETGLHVEPLSDGLRVTYDTGLKTATTFRVEATEGSAQLVVTDDYSGTPAAERQARTDEVDQSLIQWGHDLHRYLAMWNRWSRYGLWRWYMNRVWKPMTPLGRRVVFLLIVITAMEFAVFLMVLAIFVLELDKAVGL